MPKCLYCQRDSPAPCKDCQHCGMPLPTDTDSRHTRSQQRFTWFCIGLSLFCVVMFFWLPRSLV